MDWETKYASGHAQRYPWDAVVSFVFRYAKRGDRILEVGCGTGSNVWFCAREGWQVAGIDSSPSAIKYASNRLGTENLEADLRIGDLRALPWPDQFFDIVIDRAAIVCISDASTAISEVQRVLKLGGLFLFTPYSSPKDDFRFYTRDEVSALLAAWEIERFQHIEVTQEYSAWQVVARKPHPRSA